METNLKPGMFIKHKNHRDIAYRISRAVWIPEKKGYQIKYQYWNMKGMKSPASFGLPHQSFFLPAEDMQDWIALDVPAYL